MGRGGILDDALHDFLVTTLPERPALVRELEREAEASGFPIIGPLSGRVLETMARAVSARRVLELGSGFGYSAYWFSRALPSGSELVFTDGDPKNEARARSHQEILFPHVTVRWLCGDALTLARPLEGPFDVVFVDVDKHEYPAALDLAIEKVRVGGAILFDNTLWSRRVLPGADDGSRDTQGVLALHEKLRRSDRLSTFVVPVRDGVSVSIRTA